MKPILKLLIFNPFTTAFLNKSDIIVPFNKRIRSSYTDLGFIVSIFFPIVFIIMILIMIQDFKETSSHNTINILQQFVFLLIFWVLLNKDYYRARSVAKRVYGYQILDFKTNNVATSVQSMIRNLTFIIWPIEGVALLLNPKRRLGDYIAGTIVVKQDIEDPQGILNDIDNPTSYKNISRLIILSIACIVVYMGILYSILYNDGIGFTFI